MKKGLSCLAFILLLSVSLQGVELKPWYPQMLQLQGWLDYRFQSFPSVDAQRNYGHYSSNDHFVDGSLLLVYDPYSLQVETEFADTRKRNFDWDHIALTGRYLFLDDNIGDPVSFTAGLTLSRAWREAVNDISSFHHGRNEAFLHLALGKQNIYGADWSSRWWGILGVGTADRWTPWLIANAAYEWNCFQPHRFSFHLDSLWGCGNHQLKVDDFGGYGPIDHRSIDLGIRYSYEFECYGVFSLGYAYRVYAHNFPKQTSQLTLCYIFPFGPEANFYLFKAYSLLTGKNSPF